MMLMTASTELLMVFIGLEISSISSYILCGFRKGKRHRQPSPPSSTSSSAPSPPPSFFTALPSPSVPPARPQIAAIAARTRHRHQHPGTSSSSPSA